MVERPEFPPPPDPRPVPFTVRRQPMLTSAEYEAWPTGESGHTDERRIVGWRFTLVGG